MIDTPPNHINYRTLQENFIFLFLFRLSRNQEGVRRWAWIDAFKPFQDGISIAGFQLSSHFAAVQDVHAYIHFIPPGTHTLLCLQHIHFI